MFVTYCTSKKKPTIYLLEYFFGFFFQQIPCLNCPAPNSNFKKNLHFLKEFPSKIDSVTLIVLHGYEHVCIHRKPQSLFVPVLGQICNCNWLTNFILTHVGLFLCKRQLIKTNSHQEPNSGIMYA